MERLYAHGPDSRARRIGRESPLYAVRLYAVRPIHAGRRWRRWGWVRPPSFPALQPAVERWASDRLLVEVRARLPDRCSRVGANSLGDSVALGLSQRLGKLDGVVDCLQAVNFPATLRPFACREVGVGGDLGRQRECK